MTDKTETLFIVNASEGLLLSFGRDTISIGFLIGAAWFCNTQMPPSGWINFAVAFVWIIWMFGRSSKHRIAKTPEQAREWLDEKYPNGGDA